MTEECTIEAPRDETLKRLYEERENLTAQIERLQEQADSAQGGIRLYRNHRVDQFREREESLATRLSKMESNPQDDSFENAAEDLFADLKETANLAAHTFSVIA